MKIVEKRDTQLQNTKIRHLTPLFLGEIHDQKILLTFTVTTVRM